MNCARFEDRLYDEDTRQAQRGQRPLPEDVAQHAATCAACRRAWEEAAEDETELALRLRQEPSAAHRALVLERIQGLERGPAGWTRWFPVVSDALTGGAVAVALSSALLGPLLLGGQLSAFAIGVAVALFGARFKGVVQQLEGSVRLLLAPY